MITKQFSGWRFWSPLSNSRACWSLVALLRISISRPKLSNQYALLCWSKRDKNTTGVIYESRMELNLVLKSKLDRTALLEHDRTETFDFKMKNKRSATFSIYCAFSSKTTELPDIAIQIWANTSSKRPMNEFIRHKKCIW